jgi:hypothetical protein
MTAALVAWAIFFILLIVAIIIVKARQTPGSPRRFYDWKRSWSGEKGGLWGKIFILIKAKWGRNGTD